MQVFDRPSAVVAKEIDAELCFKSYWNDQPDSNPMASEILHLVASSTDDRIHTVQDCLYLDGPWATGVIYEESDSAERKRHKGYWFVDTGSNCTVVRGDIADYLGLIGEDRDLTGGGVTGNAKMETATNVHFTLVELNLNIPLPLVGIMRNERLAEWKNKRSDDYIGIIGRDVLRYCKFSYDGSAGNAILKKMRDTLGLSKG